MFFFWVGVKVVSEVMIDYVVDRAHGILQKWHVCRLQVGITWKSKRLFGQIVAWCRATDDGLFEACIFV